MSTSTPTPREAADMADQHRRDLGASIYTRGEVAWFVLADEYHARVTTAGEIGPRPSAEFPAVDPARDWPNHDCMFCDCTGCVASGATCPIDGEPLGMLDRALGGPTFYRHADGSGHLDPVSTSTLSDAAVRWT